MAIEIVTAGYFLVGASFLILIVIYNTGALVEQSRLARSYRMPRSVIDLLLAFYCVLWPATVVGMVWVAWSKKRAARRP